MASACALAIFSGKIILNFGTPERPQTLRCPIFTEGVATANSSCPFFCSPWLRAQRRLRYNRAKHFLKGGVPVCVFCICPTCIWASGCANFPCWRISGIFWKRSWLCWMRPLWTACCWQATFTTSPFPLPKRCGCWTGSLPNWRRGSCRCSPSAATMILPTGWPLALPCWPIAGSTSARCSPARRSPSPCRMPTARWMCTYCPF